MVADRDRDPARTEKAKAGAPTARGEAMSRYAADTSVSADRSRAEIERTLSKYGANQFLYGWDGPKAVIGFRMGGRMIRFLLPLPEKDSVEFTHTRSRGTRRSDAQAYLAWEQATRQRWRALALVIKAKLEAVESGITTFEEEFLAHTLLPNGTTVGEWAAPQLEEAYTKGRMPALLPALPAGKGGAP
jgi:hypothetical protein